MGRAEEDRVALHLPDGAVKTADGSFTLVGRAHGQTCHSTAGARTEARERYARLCIGVPDTIGEVRGRAGHPLRLLDIGLGLGLNVTAAFERLRELHGDGACLHVVSLESDRDLVARGLALPADPDLGFAAFHALTKAALRCALDSGEPRWCGRVAHGFELEVRFGDGRATLLEAPAVGPFDAVFLDAFSPSVEAALWEVDFLSAVATRMTTGALLSTYSAATSVRVALRVAGLAVGAGPRLGPKAQGTLAARDGPVPAFDVRTQRRVDRRAALLAEERRSASDRATLVDPSS